VRNLLDVGSGPISPDYYYQGLAESITCIDWNIRIYQGTPPNVKTIDGNFLAHDFGDSRFDAIICADVFEHVAIEQEQAFASKLAGLLVEGGSLILSLPHRGRFAWLDPYELKPGVHRALSKLGLYNKLHNGTCDIRKGHKHYTEAEIAAAFHMFDIKLVKRFGYLYEPLGAWAQSIEQRGVKLPGRNWLARKVEEENAREFGEEAYSFALSFRKRATQAA
jgi:predicted SAM-dependent methyltransferase